MRSAAVVVVLSGALVPLGAPPGSAAVDAWSPSALHGGTVTALAVSPGNASLVLAGTAGGGVFRSSDSGATWSRSSSGLPTDVTVAEIAPALASPQVFYAGTTEHGVFRSTDAGATWSPSSRGLDSATVGSIAVHPTDPGLLLAAAGAEAWRSTDAGATWARTRGPLDELLFPNVVAISPSSPGVAYSFGSGSWRSTDAGRTWRSLPATPPHVQAAAVDPRNPDVVLVGSGDGVLQTTDGGATWTQRYDPDPLDSVVALRREPGRPDTVYASSYDGRLLRSTDGGTTWSADGAGLPSGARVSDVAVTASGQLASTSHRGVFRRAAAGTAWTASSTGLRASQVNALAVPPQGGPRVYAAAEREGVFRSTDSGQTFAPAGLAGRVVTGLAVSPVSESTLWAAADDGLHRSTDAGSTWARQLSVPYESVTDVAVAPSRPATLYATTFEGGVFRSDDSGGSWRLLGLPGEVVAWSVTVHPTDPETAWVGTRFDGVARTTDGGATWTDTFDAVFYDVLDVAVDPRQPSRVYAALDSAGVYRSLDSGTTWELATGGTAPQAAATVVVDPSMPGRVWAAGYGYRRPGAFVSQDSGATWTALDSGLTTRWSMAMAVQTSGTAHLGTTAYGRESGGGAFQYTPSRTTAPAPTAPSAPPRPTAAGGDGSAVVSWTAPSDGGSPITGYTAVASPGGRACSTTGATSCTVTGLVNGTAHTFTVTARNAVGSSPPSPASSSVTPTAPACEPSALVQGPIRDRYVALRGPCGFLGKPLTAETATPDRPGRYNHFEGGSIYWSSATGAHEVHGAVRDTWSRLGWENSALGFPVTDETPTPVRTGAYNHFETGSVYWSPATGAREVRGSIRATWSRLGWEQSALGFPTTDELGTPDGRGRYNHFETGSVYWTPSTSAREVRGSIRATWSRLGWERSALGYPTTDELGTPDGRGRYNHFEHGSVYFTPTTGAHEVRGAIRSQWASLGWERSSLGYPVSDEYDVPGGRRSDFERGALVWDARTGAVRTVAR